MAAGIEIPTPVRKTGIETQLQRFPQAQAALAHIGLVDWDDAKPPVKVN